MVFETVRRARYRILANEVARHSAYSCSAVLATLILLLLLGTQILSWLWLLVLPALTLAAGAYAIWRRIPSSYQVAQHVDRTLELSDTLSTAIHFAASDDRGPVDVRRAQWTQAEGIAGGLDLRRAVPIRAPKAIYLTAALGLIASSLFALRYGLDHRLELRAPLARIVQEKLGGGAAQPQTARLRKKPSSPRPDRPQDYGLSLNEGQTKAPGELDSATDAALDTVGEPDTDNSKKGAARTAESKSGPSGQNVAGQSDKDGAEGLQTNAEGEQSADGSPGQGPGKQGQAGGKQASNNNAGESSSLLSKFRDAMSNLMSRMRPQPGADGTPQQTSTQGGRQAQNQPGNGRQNGKQGQPSRDGQQADAQDGQPGEEGEAAQNAQSKSGGESGSEPNSKQPGSGIGRQDGSKDVKLAEQLAAMGKISEIIGKRSANVTGEVTVEVQNSTQQLRTPYAQSDAHHQEAGGEISRDEVPVALQAYVQQYFEQLRKLTPDTSGRRRANPPKDPGL
jgi:hypothetical protein